MAELSIQDLYKLFEDNQLSPINSIEPIVTQQKQNSQNNFIKIGDIVVVQFKEQELRGEVNRIFEKVGIDFYDIKVGTTIIPVKFDSIIEHYPKNTKFEIIKENVQKPIEQKPIPTQIKPIVVQTPKQVVQPNLIEENKNVPKDKIKNIVKEEEPVKTIKTAEEVDEEDNKKNPENTNFNETVKVIGKITQFSSNLKLSEVIDFLAKKGIDKEKCWYFITEKNGELHLIRNNDLGFKMQPFVLSFVDLKIKNKLTESKEQIKIVGNNQFSIVSNIPQELYETVKNGLIALLSQTKIK
jgi:hypothetical protein